MLKSVRTGILINSAHMTRLLASLRQAGAFLLQLYRREGGPDIEAKEKPYPWEASYPAGIRWRLDIKPRPLFAILDEAVAKYPDKPCLEFLGKEFTYREVGRLVSMVATGFRDLGVGRGVKVGLLLPNSPYYVICFHAILKAGGSVVNFNPLYAEHEIARQIRDSGTRIIVTMNLKSLHRKAAGQFADTCLEKIVVCSMGGILRFPKNLLFALFRRKETAAVPADGKHILFERLIAKKSIGEPAEIDPERDIAVLQYTGGTTGGPKGAMLTHANLYTNTCQIRCWATEVKPGAEKFLAVIPLCHAFGMTAVMNFGLCIGAEIVLLPRFKASEVLKVISDKRLSVFIGVPTIYSAIIAHKEREKYNLSSLKFCISGGAPLTLEVKNNFERLVPCNLVEGYGLSEASPACTISPFTGRNKPNSAGLPLPGTIIDVAALKQPTKRLRLGEIGEVCITGPQVMAGYWGQEGETRAVLERGRLRTGDLGYMDEDGYLFIIDRIKDMIITGGFKIYPRMVEEAICLHPAVEEAAVCGIPDRHHGEVVKAYLKLRNGAKLTERALRAFLKDKLAPFEIPREIEFLDEIPKTLVGKASRRELIAKELRRLGQSFRPDSARSAGLLSRTSSPGTP